MLLTRRIARIKVMQTIFTHQQNDALNNIAVQNLLSQSIFGMLDMYLYWLLVFYKTLEFPLLLLNRETTRRVQPVKFSNTQVFNNPIVSIISNDTDFWKQIKVKKLSARLDDIVIKHVYEKLLNNKEYKEYCQLESPTFNDHKKILTLLIKPIMFKNDFFIENMERIYNHFEDDKEIVCSELTGILYHIQTNSTTFLPKEDPEFEEKKEFAALLLQKVIDNNTELNALIVEKIENWDTERISNIDLILIKMGLAEFLYFPTIAPKVSITEYMDISKTYSSNQSKTFINGVLDSLYKQLFSEGRIKKIGRGLAD